MKRKEQFLNETNQKLTKENYINWIDDKYEKSITSLLSIYDSLKLDDNGHLCKKDETLTEIMFRKLKAENIDLNNELGFNHLKPVKKL